MKISKVIFHIKPIPSHPWWECKKANTLLIWETFTKLATLYKIWYFLSWSDIFFQASYTFKYKTNGHKHVKIDDIPNLCAEFEEETVTSNIAKMTLSMISNSTECKIGMVNKTFIVNFYL